MQMDKCGRCDSDETIEVCRHCYGLLLKIYKLMSEYVDCDPFKVQLKVYEVIKNLQDELTKKNKS